MNEIVVYIALVLVGACLGSFAGATVWRLRAKQLQADKKAKQPYDKKEYKSLERLMGKKVKNDRSQCLHCGYQLKWYDLIPVVSWLVLRGRCRSCHHFFGWYELIMELGMVAFFVLSYVLWPGGVHTSLQVVHFILWLVAGVIMAMLFAYDAKWSLLPDRLNIALAVVGLVIVATSAAEAHDVGATLLSALGSVVAIAGLYALLFFVSKGRWVGFGDVKLGIGLGLILVDWQLGLIAVFFANFIGCLIVIPLLATKKVQRNTHIPFGPMLIGGAIIAWFVGWHILEWYMGIVGF